MCVQYLVPYRREMETAVQIHVLWGEGGRGCLESVWLPNLFLLLFFHFYFLPFFHFSILFLPISLIFGMFGCLIILIQY